MDTFRYNDEFSIDSMDGRLVEQFPEQDIQAPDDQEWDEIQHDLLRLEGEQLWLQELFRNNSAATGAQCEPVGGSTSTPKTIEIKVELQGRLTNKKSQYKFRVDPTDKVSVLRVLLVNKKAQLPKVYIFGTDAVVVNEDRSFLDQGMVGVGVPKLYVLDFVSNFS